MRLSWLIGLVLLGAACKPSEKSVAEAKRAEAIEIDRRATVIATQIAQKAEQAAETRRQADAERAAAKVEQLREAVKKTPAVFLDVKDLQMVNKGEQRHLTSLALTNKSKFLVADVRGTLDLHGEREGNTNIVASIPIELTGAIAPGASMVFSEEQHTLAGASIQRATAPSKVDFTVTAVGSVGSDTRESGARAHAGPDAGI